MFAKFWVWMKAWFVKESTELYTPKERQIYKYWNGTRDVYADPMALYRRFMDIKGDLSVDISVANSELKDAPKAYDSMVNRIRKIFSLAPLEDGLEATKTLTDEEAMAEFDKFMDYCEGTVKKNIVPSSINSPETLNATAGSSVANPPMKPGLVSGSTATEPATIMPMPPPLA